MCNIWTDIGYSYISILRYVTCFGCNCFPPLCTMDFNELRQFSILLCCPCSFVHYFFCCSVVILWCHLCVCVCVREREREVVLLSRDSTEKQYMSADEKARDREREKERGQNLKTCRIVQRILI
jgi:hypothetical protein